MKIKFFLAFILTILFFNFVDSETSAGPWKGRVIDVETREPLEGAVVLAFWERVYRTPAGGSSYFYEAKEVLTDKEGMFEMPAYTPINLLPLISYLRGPEFVVFKPGYGKIQMYIGKYLTGKAVEPKEMVLSGNTYRLAPGVIELPRLKTREERLRVLDGLPPSVPDNEMPKLIQLMNKEEIALGLQPTHLK